MPSLARPTPSTTPSVLALLAVALLAPLAALVSAAWAAPPETGRDGATRPAGEPRGATAAPAPTGAVQRGQGDEVTAGRRLYLRDCAMCHAPSGDGTHLGPPLEGVGTASVHYQLASGRMPISAPNLGLQRPTVEYTPEEVEALVEHLRPIVTGGPPIPDLELGAADVARGGNLYRTHCSGCHGMAGVGGALVFTGSAHRLSDAVAPDAAPDLFGLDPTLVAEAVLSGPGTMPRFSPDPLDREDLDAVVAYVRELQEAEDPGGFHLWHLGPVPEGAVGWFLGLGATLLVAAWIGSRVGTRGRG